MLNILLIVMQYVVDRVGLYVQAYTLYSSVRPFGCSTILGAVDKTGPTLFVVEPSGVSYVCSFYRPISLYIANIIAGLPWRSSRQGPSARKD